MESHCNKKTAKEKQKELLIRSHGTLYSVNGSVARLLRASQKFHVSLWHIHTTMTFYPTGGCRRCCELVWLGAGVGGGGGSVMKALGWLADKPRVQSLPFFWAFLLTLLMPENWCCWCSSLRGESRTEKWPTKNIHFLQFSPWQFIGYIPTRFYDRPSTTVNFFSFDSLEDVHEVRIWTDWQSRDWHVTGRKWTLCQGHRKVMEGTGLKEAVWVNTQVGLRTLEMCKHFQLQASNGSVCIYYLSNESTLFVCCCFESELFRLQLRQFALSRPIYTQVLRIVHFFIFYFYRKVWVVSFLFCFIFVLSENNLPMTGRWWG